MACPLEPTDVGTDDGSSDWDQSRRGLLTATHHHLVRVTGVGAPARLNGCAGGRPLYSDASITGGWEAVPTSRCDPSAMDHSVSNPGIGHTPSCRIVPASACLDGAASERDALRREPKAGVVVVCGVMRVMMLSLRTQRIRGSYGSPHVARRHSRARPTAFHASRPPSR